jgi:hypothetical protein
MWNHGPMDMTDLEDVAHRYKKATEALDAVRAEMQTTAVAVLQRPGVKQADVARITGWSREHLRRLREKAEMEALRRKVKELSDPTTQTTPARNPAPHRQGPPAHRTAPPEPPAELHLSPEAAALSYDRAKMLAKQAEAQRPDWGMEIRRELRHVDEQWRWHVMVEAGMQAGYIDVPYEGSEETRA